MYIWMQTKFPLDHHDCNINFFMANMSDSHALTCHWHLKHRKAVCLILAQYLSFQIHKSIPKLLQVWTIAKWERRHMPVVSPFCVKELCFWEWLTCCTSFCRLLVSLLCKADWHLPCTPRSEDELCIASLASTSSTEQVSLWEPDWQWTFCAIVSMSIHTNTDRYLLAMPILSLWNLSS